MSWLHPQLHDPSLRDTYEEVRGLAGWSDWAAFLDATAVAPREPGVYLLRDADSGIIRYAQMAGSGPDPVGRRDFTAGWPSTATARVQSTRRRSTRRPLPEGQVVLRLPPLGVRNR